MNEIFPNHFAASRTGRKLRCVARRNVAPGRYFQSYCLPAGSHGKLNAVYWLSVTISGSFLEFLGVTKVALGFHSFPCVWSEDRGIQRLNRLATKCLA